MKTSRSFRRSLSIFPGLVMAALVVGQAQAVSITVPNYSFEGPAVAPYSNTIDNWLTAGPGGTFTAVVNNSSQYGGIAGITGAQFGDIDGQRASARLFQDLTGSTFTVGDSYTLTVDVASRPDSPVANGSTLRLQLLDSSDHLAAFTDVLGSQVNSIGANVATFTVNLGTVLASDPWAGQTIRITLETTVAGGASDWVVDNVRLESIPEPGTGVLLGSLAGLALLRRRRR